MNFILSFTEFALLMLCVGGIGYYCFSIYSTWTFQHQPALKRDDFCPPVSLLKPLCGADQMTYQCLASFCQQDYPEYQIIFSVHDPYDPSIQIVEQLRADFPKVDLHLMISHNQLGMNPKIKHLIDAVSLVKHDIVCISDSDVLVGSNYLESIVQPFQCPKAGVVTCLYRSLSKGWVAALEAISTATYFMSNILTARQLREINFAMGATIAIRRSVLNEIGGLSAIADYLADDYQLGYLPAQLGYQIVLSRYIVTHVLDQTSFKDSIYRQIRWNRGIRVCDSAGYTALIFTYGSVLSLGFLWVTGGSGAGWLVFSLAVLSRLCLAWIMGVHLLEDAASRKKWWLSPVCDCISFALWGAGFIGNTIAWREHRFRLLKTGKLTSLQSERSSVRVAS
jgi:ceramide glucosyltransferase